MWHWNNLRIGNHKWSKNNDLVVKSITIYKNKWYITWIHHFGMHKMFIFWHNFRLKLNKLYLRSYWLFLEYITNDSTPKYKLSNDIEWIWKCIILVRILFGHYFYVRPNILLIDWHLRIKSSNWPINLNSFYKSIFFQIYKWWCFRIY